MICFGNIRGSGFTLRHTHSRTTAHMRPSWAIRSFNRSVSTLIGAEDALDFTIQENSQGCRPVLQECRDGPLYANLSHQGYPSVNPSRVERTS